MGERSSGMTGQPPTPDQPLPGFMLQGLIGEGGIGLVYHATQQRPRRTAAL